MGYYIQYRDSLFTIYSVNHVRALQAIQELCKDQDQDYSWVGSELVQKATTLQAALEEWRWEADVNDNGDIINLYFAGEKAGDDLLLFQAIAPYVKEGSYIEMSGEEGEIWRWFFKDQKCREIYPTITWEE